MPSSWLCIFRTIFKKESVASIIPPILDVGKARLAVFWIHHTLAGKLHGDELNLSLLLGRGGRCPGASSHGSSTALWYFPPGAGGPCRQDGQLCLSWLQSNFSLSDASCLSFFPSLGFLFNYSPIKSLKVGSEEGWERAIFSALLDRIPALASSWPAPWDA